MTSAHAREHFPKPMIIAVGPAGKAMSPDAR
jgi:hypothetical protein